MKQRIGQYEKTKSFDLKADASLCRKSIDIGTRQALVLIWALPLIM